MTVTNVQSGTLAVGDPIYGPGIKVGTTISAFGTGNGTTGTYTLGLSQTAKSQILSTAIPVVQGQTNRVPEPPAANYVVMWALSRERLETNVDKSADAKFTGTINGSVMTITNVFHGSISVGSPVYGIGVVRPSRVTALGTGTGGLGTYTVAPPQSLLVPQVLSCGTTRYLQPTLVTMQLDVHGPSSADLAQTISTMWRDDYAVQQFATSGFDVVPCYADDPKQGPFVNDQQQVEDRWMIDAVVQANIIVIVGQEYADTIQVDLIDVDAAYPP